MEEIRHQAAPIKKLYHQEIRIEKNDCNIFLGILCIATILVRHDLLQAGLVALLDGISFVIFAAGIFLDALLQREIRNICGFIAG